MENNKAKILETDEEITIAIAKAHFLAVNNIEPSHEEMNIIQDFLSKCYQMGWLDRYKPRTDGMYMEFFCVQDSIRYNAKEARMHEVINTLITKLMDGFEEILGLNTVTETTGE